MESVATTTDTEIKSLKDQVMQLQSTVISLQTSLNNLTENLGKLAAYARQIDNVAGEKLKAFEDAVKPLLESKPESCAGGNGACVEKPAVAN